VEHLTDREGQVLEVLVEDAQDLSEQGSLLGLRTPRGIAARAGVPHHRTAEDLCISRAADGDSPPRHCAASAPLSLVLGRLAIHSSISDSSQPALPPTSRETGNSPTPIIFQMVT